jgi:hypothetical protein
VPEERHDTSGSSSVAAVAKQQCEKEEEEQQQQQKAGERKGKRQGKWKYSSGAWPDGVWQDLPE